MSVGDSTVDDIAHHTEDYVSTVDVLPLRLALGGCDGEFAGLFWARGRMRRSIDVINLRELPLHSRRGGSSGTRWK